MTAQELFDKLGYEKKQLSNTLIRYESSHFETTITFITSEDKGNRVHIYANGDTFQDSGMNSYAEIKAILKQIEELGWEDDTEEQMHCVSLYRDRMNKAEAIMKAIGLRSKSEE